MAHGRSGVVVAAVFTGALLSAFGVTRPGAQTGGAAAFVHAPADGPYARIAVLRPHDGDTVDFEAGYSRHLEFHRQAKDAWTWYGWTVWAGERQRWFVYATFGHSAASLDRPVSPADDERDNVANVTPHAEFAGNALYEYLPDVSRGTGEPQPRRGSSSRPWTSRPGGAGLQAALRSQQSKLKDETLWYGWWRAERRRATCVCVPGPACRRFSRTAINRHSPRRSGVDRETAIEILNLRPTLSYGISR
jgi:hypothetical protein